MYRGRDKDKWRRIVSTDGIEDKIANDQGRVCSELQLYDDFCAYGEEHTSKLDVIRSNSTVLFARADPKTRIVAVKFSRFRRVSVSWCSHRIL